MQFPYAKVLLQTVMPRLMCHPNLLGVNTLRWAVRQAGNRWEVPWHLWSAVSACCVLRYVVYTAGTDGVTVM